MQLLLFLFCQIYLRRVQESLPLVPELPLASPFLCSNDSEADSECEPAEQGPERHESLAVHDATVSRRRDMVASRPSSPSGSSPHDTFAPLSKKVIPFGRPYRTHPSKQLTTRKRVGHFSARRLAWRCVSHRLSDRHSSLDFTSDSSLSGLSSDSSSDTSSGSPSDLLLDTSSAYSLGYDASGQTHSGPSTKVASSRSLTTSVPSSTLVLRSIAPTLADLLPPHKRFRDSYSLEDSREEHMEIGMGVEIAASDIREDEEEFEVEASAGSTMEITVDPLVTVVPLDRITEFETAQIQLEAGMGVEIAASDIREDEEEFEAEASAGSTMEITVDPLVTVVFLSPVEEMLQILRRVAEALANYEVTRAANALKTENRSQNSNDDDNGNGGNEDGGNNENGNLNENGRGAMPVARVCTYKDFMKCQPLNFKGTEGFFGLTRWFEKMEIVFHISSCPEVYQVKMVPREEDLIERYIGGLPDNIKRNVMSAEPMRLQNVIRLTNSLMDQNLKGYAIRSAKNKRIFERNQRENCAQQPPFKRQNVGGSNVARAYTAGCNEGRVYAGPHLLFVTSNHGNKPVIPKARGKVYAIGGGDANLGSNVVTGTFLLNNHYASV
uniref:Reverse transcriptase domain-containing protein n=1 Tax=Tanacetum cinerariifolium TaxID=118510 RepID=A0A699IVS6_TANCI|nr:hypothetical protein [Tanacetum cinerariifolium]